MRIFIFLERAGFATMPQIYDIIMQVTDHELEYAGTLVTSSKGPIFRLQSQTEGTMKCTHNDSWPLEYKAFIGKYLNDKKIGLIVGYGKVHTI